MDQKENKIPSDKEWVKTISDIPISDAEKKTSHYVKSPYAIAEMPPEIKIGEILGTGQIIDILGEGGFARVYKIHDQNLDLDRAVKVLLPTGKKEISDRFLTEARITARLDHPNIVKVFRVDQWSGCPFIEMEYIDGKSLEILLEERGTFPAYAVCAVGLFITQALKYAHSLDFILFDKKYKGVIHRDLKPANIMLHHDGRLKLMDFGIARPLATGLHTMGDNIVGTLQYLSPEQLNHKNIDQRTDIYAVGTILYELLCGIKAFPDEGLTDLVNKKASGIYKPFNEFPVSVPKKLVEIVDKCLMVNKDERYLNAESLYDALKIVYTQNSSVQPEDALKKFMEDPDYTPIVAKKVKKKIDNPRMHVQKFHLPEIKKIRIPHFHLIKLLKKRLFILYCYFINILKKVFSVVVRKIKIIKKKVYQINTNTINCIKHVPKFVYRIASASLGGSLAMILLLLFMFDHNKNSNFKTINNKNKNGSKSISPSIPPLSIETWRKTDVIPSIISPGKDEVVKSESLNIIWNCISTADSYSILIDTTESFLNPVYQKIVSIDTSCKITCIEPDAYYCRVGVIFEDGKICWGTHQYFNYSPDTHIPRLFSPADKDTSTNREVTFKWNKVSNTRLYHIAIASDSLFQNMIFDSSGYCDTFMTIIFPDPNITYFWHVKTSDSSDWSPTYSVVINDQKNYCAIATRALSKGMLTSAEKAIQKIETDDSCKDTLLIRLAEGYLQINNAGKAGQLISELLLVDMMVGYIRGKILLSEGNVSDALNVLDTAVQLKTRFTTRTDSSKVFYLRAVAAQALYESNKNYKNGKKAYYAWNSMKELYKSNTSHDHYRESLNKMNQLYHIDKIFSSDIDSLKKQILSDSLKKLNNKKKNRWWRK